MISQWNNTEARNLVKHYEKLGISKDIALRIYTSRLLGNDSKLVLHGGGNTSLKILNTNNKKNKNILLVKGSGKDMAKIDLDGFPSLELDNLLSLRRFNKMNDFQMVNYFKKFMVDTTYPNASVETLLHAFLPHKYIDHTHSSAILSLVNQQNNYSICKKIFDNKLAIVPYVMPGFDLSKKAIEIFEKNPNVEGLILLNHGIFTFGNTAKESYLRMIKYVNLAEKELKKNIKQRKNIKIKKSKIEAGTLANIFRKHLCVKTNEDFKRKIIYYNKELFVNDFFYKNNYSKIKGPATPDHVIRIKHKPLFIDLENRKINNIDKFIFKKINLYKKNYITYFNRYKKLNKSAKMHDPNPKLIVVKNFGIFSTGDDFKEAKIAMDLGINSLNSINDSFKYNNFKSINERNVFLMEYWPLELAKIKNNDLSLKGNIVLITGGLGTIGLATANKFKNEGCEVIIIDKIDSKVHLNDMTYYKCDISKQNQINQVLSKILSKYGGIDIVISNAGYALQKSLLDINKNILDRSFAVNFFAHHFLTQKTVEILKNQSIGGSILYNISKQAINPGKNFGSYGLPKAALMFLMKQYALEFGKNGIRFNGVNADRIKSGLLTDEIIKKRAKSRGIDINTYMKGNLLKKEVKPEDVAKAFFALAVSFKTTACILTVDGGNIEASLR